MKAWHQIYDALYVDRSSVVGQGLFAGSAIPARAKIGEFEGEVISLREAARRAKGRAVVAIVELETFALDATLVLRGFRFINHSCEPNAFFRCTPQRAEIYALRDIGRGEELTVDYGHSHHDGKLACRCGAAKCRGFL